MSCEKAVPYLYILLSVGTVDNWLSSFCCGSVSLFSVVTSCFTSGTSFSAQWIFPVMQKFPRPEGGGVGDVFVTLAYEWGGGGLNRTMICVFPVTMGRERGNQRGFGDEATGKKNSKKKSRKISKF
jgi:hypothetical protein